MVDKFDRTSIYEKDFTIVDNDGKECIYTFKPLDFKTYPKVFNLLKELKKNGFFEMEKLSKDKSEEELVGEMIDKFDESLITTILELEKKMVKNSYPDYDDKKIELFVISNMFSLLTPMFSLLNRG